MAILNNPGLNEIGRRIISERGFSPSDDRSLRRAWQLWTEQATRDQRLAAEQAHFFDWLRGLHREYQQERRSGGPEAPSLLAAALRSQIVAGRVVEDEPSGEAVVPVSDLKFRSESPEWEHPEPERPRPEVTGHPAPANPRRDPPRPPAPVRVSSLPDPEGAPFEKRAAWPVPQPSRKVAAYRQMFPELARPVATASGPKAGADLSVEDMAFRKGELSSQILAWEAAKSGTEARIEERDRLNAKERVRKAEYDQNIRDARAERERWTLAQRAVAEHGVAVPGELPEEALAACGFAKRVA